MIYFTGDKHSEIQDLSFKRHPIMRNLTTEDTLFILGDFGVVWKWDGNSKEEAYNLRWLNEQLYTTIVILGNHENWDKILQMPRIEKYNGFVRQCVYDGVLYDKIFFVTEPTILDVDGYHFLAIPGADSHDIDHLLDPTKRDFKRVRKYLNRKNIHYRVIGQSWWPQEAIDIKATRELLVKHGEDHFDAILTHDAPSGLNQWYSQMTGYRMTATEGEIFFEELAWTLDFDMWCHGHFHFDGSWSGFLPIGVGRPHWDKMQCFYQDVGRKI